MIKKVLGLIGCLAGLLFLSCEVGLGETVDVMAPSLEITSPEDGSIIMNNFTMSGSTSDDKLYVFISINVTSTATGAKVASYSGSVDTLHSSWSCSINSRHTAADGSYYFDIPDGEYTFSVTAMDKVGRSTTKSRVYKIDNTAPVVVLKRPDADDSYGKTIKVTGDIADSNTLSSLYFTAYKMNSQNKLEKITTVRQSNISGVGLDLIVGKKYENPTTEAETKLNAIYDLMYNTRAAGEDTAKIYCVVEVADSAKEYKPGSSIIKKAAGGTYTESGFTPTGNLSTSYYIYDVIYDSIYSESNSSSYKLTNSDLVSIMNGTYTDTDKAALVKTYLSENCMDTSGTELSADKVSAFNLNPANSPYFEVSGYKYENGFSSISNESKITVTVSPGRDQISLKEKTIRLVLKQCDSSGVLSDEDEVVLVESLENIEKIEDAAERAAAKNVRDQALSTGDTIKIVTSIGKRKAKNYYVVCVEGCDLDGNPIENSDGNIYGFLVESVSKPPVITITSSPEDLSVQNTYDFEFEGTLTYDEDHVYTKYVVTAKNEKDSSEAEHSIASGVMDVKDDGTWSLSLPATLFTNAGLSTDALYMCTVQFIAGYSEDFSDGSSVSVRVHVDTAKPTMSAISVSPYYSIDASTKVPTVNGTITISANVSDNYEFYETNYEIYYMDGTTKRTIQGTRLTDFAIELKNVNTVVANLPVYDLLIDFECVDKAGNKQYYSHTIKVDQNTDKPEISFSNLDESITEKSAVGENANLFGQTGSNKILGTVTDDDRINSIVFEYAPLNSSVWTEFYRKNFTSSENYVTFTLTDVILKQGLSNSTALAEGFWQVRYTVTDKDGGSDSVTKASDAICLAIDNGAPTLSITTASGELIGKDTDKEIQGTASDGNGVVKIYRYATDNTRNPSKTAEYGTEASPVTVFESATGVASKVWEDTIKATDNGDEFAYIAEDIFGRTTKLLFSYQIDSVNPLIDVTSPTTAAAIYVGSPYIASFRGTAEDPKYVKIADGTPIKLADYAALSSSARNAYKLVDASDISGVVYVVKDSNGDEITRGTANGTVSWSANIEFCDSNGDAYENAASIELYAEDGGGLTSSAVSYPVVIDTAAPVLEITGVTNSAGTALAEKDEVYYTNDGIIIKGTVTEKNLKSVTCSLNDATVVLGTYDESTGKTPFTYTVDSASAGRKTFGFTAEDKAGQMSETYNVVIVKDSTPPVISGVSIAGGYEKTTGVFYVKSGTYTLSGTTTDTYAIKETVVKVKNGSTEVTSETLTDSSWTVDLDFSDDTVWINDATATVEITAYDVAGNASAVQTVTVKFDTEKPALNTFLNWKGKDMLFLINTGKYKVGTFGKSTMMEIEGCYNETGSGIKAVYYQIIPTGSSSSTVLMDDSNYESKATGKFEASSTKEFTIKENESDTASTVSYSNVFKVNLSGFKESSATDSNKLRLVAVDNVGNVSAVEEKTLNVDTTAPKFNSVASVEKLTNTEADVTVSGSAYFVEDSGAGFIPGSENEDPTEGPVTATINGIAVTGTVGTVTNILEATTEYPDAGSKKVYYSVKINKSYLETLDSGNCIIKVTAKDAANDGDGNESYTNIATVVIDKDAPNLDIVNVTPKVGENVNGKVKVSGTASDGNALKSVTLYTGAKATDAGDVDEITYSSATYYKIEQDSTSTVYNWSATIDTTKYTDGSTVKLLAVAEDEAGNKTYKTEDLIINQSTDKPALNLTSLDASVTEYNADAKDTNLLGMGSNIIYGNVSDDDGIASINIKVDDGSVINKTESAGGATSASIALDLSNFASLTAGEHKLYITVTDIKNETSYATNSDSVNGTYFAYDNDSPSIEVVKCNDSSYSSNMWGKSEFDIYIAIADSSDSENGKNLSIECKGILKSSTGNSGSYTAQTLPTAEKAGTWTASATIGGDSISNVWKFTTSNGEGYYKRTYEVTDRYGRSASIEVSYRVDTTAPVFKAYASDDSEKHVKADVTKLIINGGSKYFVDADSDAGYSISAVDSASKPVNWFSQTQLTVTGEVEETNLKSVTLSHGGNESTQLNKNFAFSESFVNGQNTFTLTALDEAGNSVSLPSSGFYALYVDTNAPTVSVEAKKADGTTAFESGTVLGASGVIRLNITAADDPTASEMTSGISKVYIGTSASVDSSSAIATVTASELEAASNVYTFTVGSSLDDGSYTLYVRAEDVAGNLSTGEEAAAFVVDKTAPKVTIASPVTGKTVDKKITISGTVQDSNLDSSVLPVLWIKEKTSGSWAEASADSVSSRTYSSGDWSLKFDTEKYDDEKDYYIAVVFTDKAGNATAYSSSTHTIHVSQDNDRPVVVFPNVAFTASIGSATANRIWIKNSQITGTVTDSDGIKSVYLLALDAGSAAPTKDSAWGTSIYSASSGMWTVNLDSEGPKDIYFRVIDSEDGDFISSASATNDITAPKLKYNDVILGESANYKTVLYSKLDWKNPTIPVYAYSTSFTSSQANFDALVNTLKSGNSITTDGSAWKVVSTLDKVGGSASTLYIFVKANDPNGIDSVAVKLAGTAEHVTKLFDHTADDDTENYYALYSIDLTQYTGYLSKQELKITATDNATNSFSVTQEVNIDNKAPEVDFITSSTKFYGTSTDETNKVIGTAADNSDISQLWLGFSASASTKPTVWEDILLNESVAASRYDLVFDADTDKNTTDTDGSYHLKKLNDIVDAVYGDGTSTDTTITEKDLYVWIYGVDSLNNGNDSSARTLKISVYTQGDKPTTIVSYPASGSDVGGTIRITGTTKIATSSVKGIFVQIDPTYDSNAGFNDDWASEVAGLIGSKEVEYVILGEDDINTGYGETAKTTIKNGILAGGDAQSWTLPINTLKEFDTPDKSNRSMAIRVYSVSETGKVSDPVLVPFTLDPGAPTFGGDNTGINIVSADRAVSRSYSKDIWLSNGSYATGSWVANQYYLEVSCEDDSGIKTLTYSRSDSSTTEYLVKDSTAQKDWVESTTGGNFKLKIPMGEATENDFGNYTFTLEATEGGDGDKSTSVTFSVNYDNKRPVFANTTLASNTKIVQSDSQYIMTGTFAESSSGSSNQSGFERIAFYITRTLSSKDYLVDPMLQKGSAGTANRYEIKDTDFTSSEGLYWRSVSGCSTSYNTTDGYKITLPSSLEADKKANIRAGGLCKVDNVIYRIKNVSGSAVTLSSAITSHDSVTVDFAFAQVIDHTVKEMGIPTYYGDSTNEIDNDDGDQMVDYFIDTTGTWTVSINSQNIKDGNITLHFVAFDAAGNYVAKDYDATVSNNAPRIAGVTFGTDRNGDGVIADTELIDTYAGLYNTASSKVADGVNVSGTTVSGNKIVKFAIPNNGSKIDTLSGNSVLTIKGDLKLIPEIVGGNDGLGYYYSVDGNTSALTQLADAGHDDSDDVRAVSSTTFTIDTVSLLNNTTADGLKDFSIKIQDYTEDSDPNVAEILMRMTLALRDGEEPKASIRPFYWSGKGANKSSVYYSGSTAYGHIELEEDWKASSAYDTSKPEFDDDPKVSGIIYIEGQAKDNVLVNELYLSFPGLAEDADGTFGKGFARFAYRENGVWKNDSVDLDTQGVEVVSITESTESGTEKNVVNYKLAVNTAKITTVAATDVAVQVQAKDRGAPTLNAAGTAIASYTPKASKTSIIQTSGEAYSDDNTPYYKMDVVPYITKISTSNRKKAGLKDSNIRSAGGKYSIMYAADEDAVTYDQYFITVTGYNLNPDEYGTRIVSSTAKSTTAATYDSAESTFNFGEELTASVADKDGKEIAEYGYKEFWIENTIPKSGYLEVFVNGVRTLNNINNDDSHDAAGSGSDIGSSIEDWTNYYNREPDYNSTKNVRLTDDRYLIMWDMHDGGTRTKNGGYPTMFMEGNNPVFGYFNPSGGPKGNYGTGADTGAGTQYPEYAMPQRIKYNADGTEAYTEYLAKNSAGDQMGTGRDDGGRYYHISVFNRGECAMYMIYDRFNELYGNGTMGWAPGITIGSNRYLVVDGSNNGIGLETINYGGLQAGRYQYPKIIAKGNSKTGTAYVYCAYYDDYYGQIIMRTFQCGKTVNGTSYSLDTDHSDLTGTTYAQKINFKENGTNTGNNSYSTGRLKGTEEKEASKFFDMKVTDDYHIVLIYYDENDSCLKLRYSTNPVTGSSPTSEIAWTDSSVPFPEYVGNYVSMDLDSENGIHISAFDATDSNLVYMYLSSCSSTDLEKYTVDQASAVGNWTQIKLNESDVPYIAYYNATETGGRDSIKLAYAKAAAGSVTSGVDVIPGTSLGTGYTLEGWEYMTVPAITPPQGGNSTFQNVCLGFDTSGVPVVGYAATNLEFGKQLSE